MTEEEIVKTNREFKKMINKSEINESVAQALLVRLQELHITLMILQKTGIGKTVNKLRRTTTNKDLSTMAKSILKKWKQLLPESFVTASTDQSNSQVQKGDSINKFQHYEASNMIEQKTSSSTISRSNIPWQTTDIVRLKSRELLANTLSVGEIPQGSGDPIELSARIEDAIFKEIQDTKLKYGRRIRSQIFNLRDLKNPNLRTDVLLGRITPERLAVMTTEEMASDTLKKECAKFKEIAHRESQLAVDEGIGSDLLQCERCKKNNCSYSELQTLSGDEPMTLFVLCKNCGHRWRG